MNIINRDNNIQYITALIHDNVCALKQSNADDKTRSKSPQNITKLTWYPPPIKNQQLKSIGVHNNIR